MDTFYLLMKYNYRKDDPLVADYNKNVQDFGEGKCATFFMGDWKWAVMGTLKNVDQDYGFIPLPWSNFMISSRIFNLSRMKRIKPKVISFPLLLYSIVLKLLLYIFFQFSTIFITLQLNRYVYFKKADGK